MENSTAATIELNTFEESVTLHTQEGSITFGNFADETGEIAEDMVAIEVNLKNPANGFIALKIADLQKLIRAYNTAIWSENQI